MFGGRQPGDDQVDALGIDDAMLGRHAPGGVEPVDVGAGGVDDRAGLQLEAFAGLQVGKAELPVTIAALGIDQVDVVGHRRPGLDRRADEPEDEAGVVVAQVGVPVLDAAPDAVRIDDRFGLFDRLGAVQLGWPGAELADAPVGGGAEGSEPWRVGRAVVQCGQKRQLGHVVGVGLHQPVAALTQLVHQRQLVIFQVLEPAPHQVGALLAGLGAEVGSVDQGDRGTPPGQRGGRDRPVDSAAHDGHVDHPVAQSVDVGVSQCHG